MNIKYLCIIETPLHLISLLTWIHNYNIEVNQCYIIINNQFGLAKNIYKHLNSSDIYAGVNITNDPYELSTRLGKKILKERLFFNNKAKKTYLNTVGLSAELQFDYLVCCSVTKLTSDAKYFSVRKGKTIFLDDGSGSHGGQIFEAKIFIDDIFENPLSGYKSHIFKSIMRLGFRSILEYNFKEIYLFTPNYRTYNLINGEPKSLTYSEAREDIQRFYQPILDCNPLHFRQVIYFTMPDHFDDVLFADEIAYLKMLDHIMGEHLTIMVHPRSCNKHYEFIEKAQIVSEQPWEAILSTGMISDDHILIGFLSTAQMNPKLLFNIEPYLVFTCLLYKSETYDSLRQIEKQFEELYLQKYKINHSNDFLHIIEDITEIIDNCPLDVS